MNDTLSLIFSHFKTADIHRMKYICKRFKEVCESDKLWRIKCERYSIKKPSDPTWFEWYLQQIPRIIHVKSLINYSNIAEIVKEYNIKIGDIMMDPLYHYMYNNGTIHKITCYSRGVNRITMEINNFCKMNREKDYYNLYRYYVFDNLTITGHDSNFIFNLYKPKDKLLYKIYKAIEDGQLLIKD
jgi:hypothetical protein